MNIGVVGPAFSGKTSLIQAFCEEEFSAHPHSEELQTRAEHTSTIVTLRPNQPFTIRFWETTSEDPEQPQESHELQDASPDFERQTKTDVLFLCMDVSDMRSYANREYAKMWLERIDHHHRTRVCTVLIGTKSDLRLRQAGGDGIKLITTEQAVSLCDEIGAAMYVELSAMFLEPDETLDILQHAAIHYSLHYRLSSRDSYRHKLPQKGDDDLFLGDRDFDQNSAKDRKKNLHKLQLLIHAYCSHRATPQEVIDIILSYYYRPGVYMYHSKAASDYVDFGSTRKWKKRFYTMYFLDLLMISVHNIAWFWFSAELYAKFADYVGIIALVFSSLGALVIVTSHLLMWLRAEIVYYTQMLSVLYASMGVLVDLPILFTYLFTTEDTVIPSFYVALCTLILYAVYICVADGIIFANWNDLGAEATYLRCTCANFVAYSLVIGSLLVIGVVFTALDMRRWIGITLIVLPIYTICIAEPHQFRCISISSWCFGMINPVDFKTHRFLFTGACNCTHLIGSGRSSNMYSPQLHVEALAGTTPETTPLASAHRERKASWLDVEPSLLSEIRVITSTFVRIAFQNLSSQIPLLIATFFIGHLPDAPLLIAGAGLAIAFTEVTGTATAMGMSSAISTLVPQAIGAGKKQLLAIYFQRAAWVCALVLVPVAVLQSYGGEIMCWLGQPAELCPIISAYCNWLILYIQFFCLISILSRIGQALGYNTELFWTSMICALLVIPLNYVFIYYLEVGYIGTAVSVGICTVLNAVMNIVVLVYRGYGFLFKPLPLETIFTYKGIVVEYLGLSLPILFQIALPFWFYDLCVILSGYIQNPSIALSAGTIVGSILVCMSLVSESLYLTISMRVGQYIGAGSIFYAKRSVLAGFVVYAIYAAAVGTVMVVFRHDIPYVYTSQPDIVETVSDILGLVVFRGIVYGIYINVAAVYLGLGKPQYPATVMFFTQWVLSLSVMFVLLFVMNFKQDTLYGMYVIWVTPAAVGYVIGSSILSVCLVFKMDWSLALNESKMRIRQCLTDYGSTACTETVQDIALRE